MFNQMENVLATRQRYVRQKLQFNWNAWIKGRTDRARTRAESYLTDNFKKLSDGYGSAYQRQDQYADPILIGKIDALGVAIRNRQAWANPFP